MFTVIVGTYEKALYGFEVYPRNGSSFLGTSTHENRSNADKNADDEIDLELEKNYKYDLKPIFGYVAHMGCIKGLSATSRWLVSASTDESIKVYDLQKRVEIGSALQHQGAVTCVEFFKKSNFLSGSADGTICVWRTKDWECLSVLKGHKKEVTSLSIHPSGRMALSTGRDKTLKLWNLIDGKCAYSLKLSSEPGEVRWSPSGDIYAIVFDCSVEIYSGKTAQKLQTLKEPKKILTIAFLNDHIIASGGENREVNLWEIATGKCLHTLRGFVNRVKGLAIVPKTIKSPLSTPQDMKYPWIVSISSDQSVKLWDLDESVEHPVGETIVDGRPTALTCSFALEDETKDEETEESSQSSQKKRKRNAKGLELTERERFSTSEHSESENSSHEQKANQKSKKRRHSNQN
jgi:protein MAK11